MENSIIARGRVTDPIYDFEEGEKFSCKFNFWKIFLQIEFSFKKISSEPPPNEFLSILKLFPSIFYNNCDYFCYPSEKTLKLKKGLKSA